MNDAESGEQLSVIGRTSLSCDRRGVRVGGAAGGEAVADAFDAGGLDLLT